MVQVVRYDIEEIADVAVQRLGVVLVVVEDALDGAGRVVWSQRLVADVLKTDGAVAKRCPQGLHLQLEVQHLAPHNTDSH